MTTEDQKFIVKVHPHSRLSIILVASIIVSSALLIYIIVTPRPSEKFTEFYLLDSNGKASNYPTNMKVGEDEELIIGVVNREYKNTIYSLEVNFNGNLIHEERFFLLENEKWERIFTFESTKKGANQKLEFLLYKDQHRETYRTLHLWVSVT